MTISPESLGRHRATTVVRVPSRRRLAAASLVLAGMISATLISLWTPHLRVCGAEVDRTICRPLTATDAPVPLSVLLALLLVFPDITKLKFAGVEIERSTIPPGESLAPLVRTTERKADEFRRDIGKEGGGQGYGTTASG